MNKTVDFRKGLYHTSCEECKNKLYWEANFDADGTSWFSECCGQQYVMSIHKVNIQSYPLEIEDDENEDNK